MQAKHACQPISGKHSIYKKYQVMSKCCIGKTCDQHDNNGKYATFVTVFDIIKREIR